MLNFREFKEPNGIKKRIIILFCILMICLPVNAIAKSVYVISSINSSPSPIQSYDIQGQTITYQATYGVPKYAGGAVGLTIDTDTNFLFVTYEVSNVIQLVDGATMTGAGSVTAPGASNMAGIVVDQSEGLVYAVDRNTANLYIYNWNTWSHTLTLKSQLSLSGVSQAHGIALDETRGLLYIGDLTNTVKVYDTSDWSLSFTFDVSQSVMGIAVDAVNQFVYTGNASPYAGSLGLVCKYDFTTATETTQNIRTITGIGSDNVLGLAVDKDTGTLYLTTGDQGSGGSDRLMVFDSNLNLLDTTADIGDPTGVCVPGKDISFNPLMLTIHSAIGDRPVGTDTDITYHICFSNPTSNIVSGTTVFDSLPTGSSFVSATGNHNYDILNNQVSWDFGDVNPGDNNCVDITLHINAAVGEQILHQVTLNSSEYYSTTREYLTYVTDDPDEQQNRPIGSIPELPVPKDVTQSGWGELSIYPDGAGFDSNKPTIIISHGWNMLGSDKLPKWMKPMGDAIGDKANVFLWNWLDKATTHVSSSMIFDPLNPYSLLTLIPSENVPQSGKKLGKSINEMLQQVAPGYSGQIHLIGFSLGSGVIIHAANELDSQYRDNLNQLSLLDGPLYLKGMDCLLKLYTINRTKFVEHYWSLAGMPLVTVDTNIYLLPFEAMLLQNRHGYAHEWYRSSMTNFEAPSPLPTVPGTSDSTPWGFYWSSAGDGKIPSQDDASYLYHSDPFDYWKLYTVKDHVENVKGAVEYTAEAVSKWTQEQWDKLEEIAKKTGQKIKVFSINTFESAKEAGAFVTKKVGNAVWEFAVDHKYAILKLIINSEAVTSATFDVPVGANSMRFSYEFLVADKGCILEAFIEDIPVFLASGEDYLDKGMQDSDWIDVSSFAGQEINFSIRLSNPDDGKQGVVGIDDIIFAKVIPYSDDEIPINSGWNLMSFDRQPLNTNIQTVLYSISAGECESVWAYDNGEWKVYDPKNPGMSDLTEMEAGVGYFINMNVDSTLSCSLTDTSGPVNLNIGWNLVGYNSENPMPIGNAMASIDRKYISVWSYANGTWKFYDPAYPGFSNLTQMEPGTGYWINAKEACTWTLP